MELENRCLHDNLNNCDFVKTILMLCVIVGHCCGFWTNAWFPVIKPYVSNDFLGFFANWLGSFHISCFTLVSGYIYYYVKHERNGNYSLRIMIKKKIRRLIFPYIFVSLFWVIPINNIFFQYTVLDILNNFILGGGAEQLWFLLMLFNVFVFFNLLSFLFKKNGHLGFVILFVLYIVGDSLSRKSFLNVFQIFTSFKYLIFFSSGYYIRKFSMLIFSKKMISLNNAWFIMIFLIVNNVLSTFSYNMVLYDSFFIKILCKLISMLVHVNKAILAFAILLFISERINWHSRFFGILKDNNFNMYLFHQQIVYVMLYLFNGFFSPEMHALINFIVSSSFSLLLSIVVRKNGILRFCLGEKR